MLRDWQRRIPCNTSKQLFTCLIVYIFLLLFSMIFRYNRTRNEWFRHVEESKIMNWFVLSYLQVHHNHWSVHWFINGITLPFAIEPSTPQTGRRIKYVESKVPQAIVTHPKSKSQQAVHFQSSSGTNTVDICTRRFVCEEQKTTASIKYELQILIRWVLSTVSTQQQKLTIFHTSWMN